MAMMYMAKKLKEVVMAIELYNDGKHVCLMFNDLVDDSGGAAVQANQFLIVSDGEGP